MLNMQLSHTWFRVIMKAVNCLHFLAMSHHLKRCNVRAHKKAHQVATGLDIDQRTAEQVIPFVEVR